MVDWLSYVCFRVVYQLLGAIPHRILVAFFGRVWLLLFKLVPRLKSTIESNLKIAFPGRDRAWCRGLISRHAREMGRLTADIIRLPSIDEQWIRRNVEFWGEDSYRAAHRERGVLVVTGHLGSFELLGHVVGMLGVPVAAIARRFKSERLNTWWETMRCAGGNSIIDRNGAFKKMIRALQKNVSVAVLFDQNVKRKHAEFVPWFSSLAATTKSLAVACLQTDCPVFIASIKYGAEDGKYHVWFEELDIWDIRRDTDISEGDKINRITAEISNAFCARITEFPEGWFWTHRRWKTRPDGEENSPYSSR
jgi:KDO2-lipid IV(A) lauroyltransferase